LLDAETPPTFESLNLSKEMLEVLATMGYTHPTPVQRAVFEPATRGSDLVVQARTGTGKTTAFGLPIVENVVRKNVAAVQVLVLCPTRELALQVCAEIERLGRAKSLKPIAIYGGAPMGRQIDALAAGAQVVVGTPGRVLDHLHRKTLDPSQVRMLVLDEADEMLSMGFERELSAILERLPKTRQTLLFSATIPSDIERMARDRLREPEFITLSGDHVGALEILHFVYLLRGDKLQALARILEVDNPESAIIFCNTKVETERVAEALERQGFTAAWLNGDLPQGEREQVMSSTREGKLRFLVATDVAARGIDISHLTHVINYDFPDNTERYVHRTGRTGRAGRTGTAISIITPKDIGNLYLLRLTYKIRPIEKQLPTAGELKTRAEADLVQMLADAFLSTPAHPEDLALARRLLSHDSAEHIVAGLLRDHLGARPEAAEEAAAARRSKVVKVPTSAPERASTPRLAPTRAEPAAVGDQGESVARDAAESTPAVAPAAPADGGKSRDRGRVRRERPRRLPEPDEDALRISWVEEPQFAAQDVTFAEIFVNIGRQDGVTSADLQRVLTETAEISRAETGRIRVRDRSSFVSVKRELLAKALTALNAATFSGKACQAEPARARSAGTSSPNDG
jgi:ATP-dependent RNA helicase DeaD